jgi:5'-deoxynucleotidase YfbR-like HD superfamily hydrolase
VTAAGTRRPPPTPRADATRADATLAARVPLARELTTLKRVRDAARSGSWAERAFARAWRAIVAGEPAATVARRELAAAGAAARLGALDAEWMATDGWPAPRIADALRRGWTGVAGALAPALPDDETRAIAAALDDVARAAVDAMPDAPPAPPFVARLAAQPRAGPTHPDVPRLVLLPAESHAEHCWAVAVIGALLAPAHAADAGTVFLAGLAHHLPNAWLPDAGWAADVALDGALGDAWERLGARALDELPETVRETVAAAFRLPRDVTGAEARAFHAADALDRVLEMEWFARAGAFALGDALAAPAAGGFDVLHPGPAQAVERAALAAMGFVP